MKVKDQKIILLIKIIFLFLLIVCTGIIFIYLVEVDTSTETVSFLNVGQGDAALIEVGHIQTLIDTGDGVSILSELAKTMPFFDRTIELVVITHSDKDHIGGLKKVLQKYNVSLLIATKETLSGIEIPYDTTVLSPLFGQEVRFRNDASLRILFPDRNTDMWETNQSSIIAKLTIKNKNFLFTGDTSKSIEEYLVNSQSRTLLQSDVLKVGHHGSKTSSSILFLEVVRPQYSIISAGENNRYGHPHQEVVDALEKVKTKIIETKNGRIEFSFNEDKLRVLQKK